MWFHASCNLIAEVLKLNLWYSGFTITIMTYLADQNSYSSLHLASFHLIMHKDFWFWTWMHPFLLLGSERITSDTWVFPSLPLQLTPLHVCCIQVSSSKRITFCSLDLIPGFACCPLPTSCFLPHGSKRLLTWMWTIWPKSKFSRTWMMISTQYCTSDWCSAQNNSQKV